MRLSARAREFESHRFRQKIQVFGLGFFHCVRRTQHRLTEGQHHFHRRRTQMNDAETLPQIKLYFAKTELLLKVIEGGKYPFTGGKAVNAIESNFSASLDGRQ